MPAPVSLFETLGTAQRVGEFLKNSYVENPVEKERRRLAAQRDDLHENSPEKHLDVLVSSAFSAQLNRDLRRKLLAWAKVNNLIKRIVNEKATVYSEPAQRSLLN